MVKISILYPNTGKLQGDMPNYTDIETVIQVSEVAITQSHT